MHAFKTGIYEIFVKPRSNRTVLSFIVFSTLYKSQCIFEIKVDDSSSALRFFRNSTVKENIET